MAWLGNGIGVLGISGKYGPISEKDIETSLSLVFEKYDFLDTASVYGEGFSFNRLLKKYWPNNTNREVKLINKFGANIPTEQNPDVLIKEFEVELDIFDGRTPDVVMLHRPHLNVLDRDIQFNSYLGQGADHSFGICTNNLAVAEAYVEAMQVDVVQVALNFLDLTSNIELLSFLRGKGVRVHARSVLSSGVLSGQYQPSSNVEFTDPLRSRFTNNEANKAILEERLSKMKLIEAYFEQNNASQSGDKLTMAQFVYNVMGQCPLVDDVVKGGSNPEQIAENALVSSISDSEFIKEIFSETALAKFSARYI